ncbi:MAG: YgiT-type zinc finger protein [Chloroflexi bacterium]|nr:YgiT-type zinc finger protein [Chloroflexota bacterium]
MKCDFCRIGRYQSTKLPFVTEIDEQIMIIPHVSAQRCDMCGHVLFNEDFLERLQYMLDKLGVDDFAMTSADWLKMPEQSPSWQSSRRSS